MVGTQFTIPERHYLHVTSTLAFLIILSVTQTYLPDLWHNMYRNKDSSGVDPSFFEKISPNQKLLFDGCFDVFHFGHANALRQAKQFGGKVVAGVHTDEELKKNKGEPVYTFQERIQIVRSIRWVDEIYPGAPFKISLSVLQENNIDFAVHGDDISVASDGLDVHSDTKSAGRYRMIRRTRGISSTEVVGRLLLASKGHAIPLPDARDQLHPEVNISDSLKFGKRLWCKTSYFDHLSGDVITLRPGGGGSQERKKGDRQVVYVDGQFDMFHSGVVAYLERARQMGDYVVAGIFSDGAIMQKLGDAFPILNLEERSMCLSACKYVDEIVLAAPLELSEEFVRAYGIKKVARDVRGEQSISGCEFAGKKGILHPVDSGSDVSVHSILQRIVENRFQLESTYNNKAKKGVSLTLPGKHNLFSDNSNSSRTSGQQTKQYDDEQSAFCRNDNFHLFVASFFAIIMSFIVYALLKFLAS